MTKPSATIAILAALACAAGAYYWAHGLGAFGRASKAAQPALAAPILATGKAEEASVSPTLSKTTRPSILVATADGLFNFGTYLWNSNAFPLDIGTSTQTGLEITP